MDGNPEFQAEIREELVTRVLNALLADAERCGGELKRSDVDRLYARRDLTVVECADVERRLSAAQVGIADDMFDETEEGESDASGAFSSFQLPTARYLSEQEERDCGRRMALAKRLEGEQAPDGEYAARCQRDAVRARDLLITTNLRWVRQIARKIHRATHLTELDLFQEGVLGLIRATELYDPELGFRFKTYATWWIRQAIHRAIANGEREVRLPVYVAEQRSRLRRARYKFAVEHGREPSVAELARFIGHDEERLAKLIWRLNASETISGETPVGEDLRLFDMIVDDATPSPAKAAEYSDLRLGLSRQLRTLTAREERVIRMRFGVGMDSTHTLEEVGQQFGVTRERIRQIEAKGLRKLKHPTRSRYLRGHLD